MANYFCFDKSCLSGFSLKANSYDDYRTGVAISFQLFKLYYPVCNEIFQSCMLLCIFCQSNVIKGHRSLGQNISEQSSNTSPQNILKTCTGILCHGSLQNIIRG